MVDGLLVIVVLPGQCYNVTIQVPWKPEYKHIYGVSYMYINRGNITEVCMLQGLTSQQFP